MQINEFIPIFILIFAIAMCLTTAVILGIRHKKTRIMSDDVDFIENFVKDKKQSVESKGMSWSKYIALLIGSPLFLGTISYLFVSPKMTCIVFVAIGIFVPEMMIRFNEKKKKQEFEAKYATALRQLSSSLNSGRTLEQAVDDIAGNKFMDDYITKGFRQISSDLKVGVSIHTAFKRFAEYYNSDDARDVATAIMMQSQVGGSEALVINSISQNIRERIMSRKEMKTLFADTDILILAMDILPWLIVIALVFIAPEYIHVFFQTPSMLTVFIGIMCFTTIGSFVIRRLVKDAKEGR